MKPQRVVVLVLAGLAGFFLLWQVLAPRFEPTTYLSGYIEGEALYFAAPVAGKIIEVGVRRGETIAGGQRLFTVDPAQLIAQRDQAVADLAAAEADAKDARQGERPAELAAFDAEIASAEARVQEAKATLNRTEPLVQKGVYAPARLDDTRAAYESAVAQLRAAQSRRDAATLGRRDEQITAADARVSRARAALEEAKARLAELSPAAPGSGRVEDVFYHEGEWAPANEPIVSMIPDDRVFVRFFVPETDVARYQLGETVSFSCDGCPEGQAAEIVFISTRPEFTPPVIYSRNTRDRLVFMVEARPENAASLPPGLPVDVVPAGGSGS